MNCGEVWGVGSMRGEVHSWRLRVGRLFLGDTPRGSVILGDLQVWCGSCMLQRISGSLPATESPAALAVAEGRVQQIQSGFLQVFQWCLPLAKHFCKSFPSVQVTCVLSVTLLHIFPHSFTDLNFDCTACDNRPIKGKCS